MSATVFQTGPGLTVKALANLPEIEFELVTSKSYVPADLAGVVAVIWVAL